MLDRLKRRAAKAGLLNRIDARIASPDSMGISDLHGSIDFTLAFAVVHEVPDAGRFFAEVSAASKLGALLLLAEPKGHVKVSEFDSELRAASQVGLNLVDRPSIRHNEAALLKKSDDGPGRIGRPSEGLPIRYGQRRASVACGRRRSLRPNWFTSVMIFAYARVEAANPGGGTTSAVSLSECQYRFPSINWRDGASW